MVHIICRKDKKYIRSFQIIATYLPNYLEIISFLCTFAPRNNNTLYKHS